MWSMRLARRTPSTRRPPGVPLGPSGRYRSSKISRLRTSGGAHSDSSAEISSLARASSPPPPPPPPPLLCGPLRSKTSAADEGGAKARFRLPDVGGCASGGASAWRAVSRSGWRARRSAIRLRAAAALIADLPLRSSSSSSSPSSPSASPARSLRGAGVGLAGDRPGSDPGDRGGCRRSCDRRLS
jgi:hypothetical protein